MAIESISTFLLFITPLVSTLSSTTTYVRDVMFDDQLPVSGYVRSFPARSVAECATRCSDESECFSFFYTASANACQIHDTVLEFDTFTGLVNPTPTTKYFVSPDYVAPTTAPYQVPCPVNDGPWVKGVLPDSTVLFFRIFTTTAVLRSYAKQTCIVSGGRLPTILTLDKMNFFLDNLMTCPDLINDDFWLDGNNSADPFVWVTSAGDLIPMSQGDFWYPHRPNNPYTERCLWIPAVKDHLLDDTQCSTKAKTICEKD